MLPALNESDKKRQEHRKKVKRQFEKALVHTPARRVRHHGYRDLSYFETHMM